MYEKSIFPLLRLFLGFEMNWIFEFSTLPRDLTKFHAGSEQPLVCVVIISFIYPTVKNNNTTYHAFGKYWMRARGFLNYRFKYCWPKVICCSLHVYQTNCTCVPNELYMSTKRTVHVYQTNCTCLPNELYMSTKRTVHVYQTNSNGILRKNCGSLAGGQAKIWGVHGPPNPPPP